MSRFKQSRFGGAVSSAYRIDIHHLKAAISPSTFYQTELSIKPKGLGWNDGGICPFHDDKRPGSFKVNLSSGGFICFSCGAKGGDIFAFLQLRDGLTFPEALRKLANDWGVV